MADEVFLGEMRQVLDEVYRDRRSAAVRDVYARASAHVRLAADRLSLLNEIPEDGYTRQEMIDAIDNVIRRRGQQDTLGLLGASTGPAEHTPETAHAVREGMPLDTRQSPPPA